MLFDRSLYIKITVVSVVAVALFSDASLFAEYSTSPEIIRIQDISSYERRFEKLKETLPTFGVAGYISDCLTSDQNCQARYYVAQYAVLPIVLEQSLNHSLIVGNFSTPAAITAICKKHGLVSVRDFDNGLVLLRKVQE